MSGGLLRVGFVCQWYHPEAVTQPGWIVDGLRNQGARVEVLTGIPNYPDGHVPPGYRAWDVRTDVVDGVLVHRTPLYPSHDKRTSRRIVNYLTWALSSTLLGQRHLRHLDVALVYSSPATAALAAWVTRKLAGTPYVLLVQDLWPDSVFASGFMLGRTGRVARRALGRMATTFYGGASRVLVISPGMIDVLVERGVPRERIALVYNWVPREPGRRAEPAQTNFRDDLGIPDDHFVIMYAGNHGGAQALASVIRGMALIAPTHGIHLVLVGDGVEKETLVELALTEAPSRVHFLGPVTREAIGQMMESADVHLVSLAPDPLFRVTMPSKLQSILAAGLPVLVCGEGDVADIAQEAGAGKVCAPGKPEAFAEAAKALKALPVHERRAMGARGRRYYEANMSPDVGSARLMEQLAAAVNPETHSTRLNR